MESEEEEFIVRGIDIMKQQNILVSLRHETPARICALITSILHQSMEDANTSYICCDLAGVESTALDSFITTLDNLSSTIEDLKEHARVLLLHECQYEDDYCIICGRDGRA
jgi:plasmid replication initiation protein